MFVGGHGDSNPNTNWLDSRGFWLSYGVGVLVLHLVLLSVPVFSIPVAWTLTNLIHNTVCPGSCTLITFSICRVKPLYYTHIQEIQ
jgi:hypothetical protein